MVFEMQELLQLSELRIEVNVKFIVENVKVFILDHTKLQQLLFSSHAIKQDISSTGSSKTATTTMRS